VFISRFETKRTEQDFDAIKIGLASPEDIRGWSYGEVIKPETINYRSFKPEKDGLFCERIFGPTKDWECYCGKYKRIRFKGVVCDKCGVEVTQSKVRRERMAHIELAVPVCHIWYFKAIPSRIGHLLGKSVKELERVLYYESFTVVDNGETPLEVGQLLTEDEYYEALDLHGRDAFRAEMGAPAIRELLKDLELDELSVSLRRKMKTETSIQRRKDALKRLKIVEDFRNSSNKPEWMILNVIPVIPPDLRPLVPLEGGRFATSDLNDLYRRVINRNNRLKKLMDIRAPEVILRNEKRMLQEAVDALFDNGRRSRVVRGEGNRPLKSLSDLLKGKQGRFRQNLLGKRVDYSGRSVIVVGPELKLNECGLPKTMALELFKPFIIHRVHMDEESQSVKSAKKLVEREDPAVWDTLEEIIKDHPVMLNRAPTLHRLGIQAFQPVLVEGKAIRIHPLVCTAFNADFDGDQMAVHVPLSYEAQIEARVLMIAGNNLLSPAHGKPIATPSQDIVLGCYYLTEALPDAPGAGRAFSSTDEVLMALDAGVVDLHALIKLRLQGEIITTTPGRVILNQVLPVDYKFVNSTMTKSALEDLVGNIFQIYESYETSRVLDNLKDLGFRYATSGGITIGVDDMIIPAEKLAMIEKASNKVDGIKNAYLKGLINASERYAKIIDTWNRTAGDVTDALFKELEEDRHGFNPVHMMASSGARGKSDQIKQLSGMRGLMQKPLKRYTGQIGETIETPILSNFREGLSVLEYFISTHGARKGLADTALKTADAGYLTRRLVDVAQDVIITSEDCNTILGITAIPLKDGTDIIQSLYDRIVGRVALQDVVNPLTGETIVNANEEITKEQARATEDCGIESVRIRTVLTCEARRGVCAKCYGRNLATGKMVEKGEAVGVIAAQSIGEPGTQLTLRTFHIGGAADLSMTESQTISKVPGIARYKDIKYVEKKSGERIAIVNNGSIIIENPNGQILTTYDVPYGGSLLVEDGVEIEPKTVLFQWDPFASPIISNHDGVVRFLNILEEMTYKVEHDSQTGRVIRMIIEDKEKKRHPVIEIVDSETGDLLREVPIPLGSHLEVKDGQKIGKGEILVKRPAVTSKTRDITGGLPRVAELFEARHPKDAAVISEIDGVVKYGNKARGYQKITVVSETGEEREYNVPLGKHMRAFHGERVSAGSKLCEGSIDPHDLLRIKGANEVQEYLLNEIQEVYRVQGVEINDKHIEIIVRQMLQKVKVEDAGDTTFLEDQQVDKLTFKDENQRVLLSGQVPATSQPMLLGITRASLNTESFVSAASFQETTKVLTDAAVRGKRDNLLGLKENVIMGHLIPAGTGLPEYRQMDVIDEDDRMIEEEERLAAEQAALEKTIEDEVLLQEGEVEDEAGEVNVAALEDASLVNDSAEEAGTEESAPEEIVEADTSSTVDQ